MIRSTRIVLAASLLLLALNATAAEFTLKDIQGHVHHLSDYRGKWVLVNFWATWCAPCLEEIPELATLYKAHKDTDLIVIGIAMEYPSAQIVQDFLKEHTLPYPVVLGDYKIAKQIGAVAALPTSYLFDQTGKLASSQSGTVTRAGVEEFIRSRKFF
ncbi:MAG: TlpA disulfide reductase family protein [Nitrosomonadales bacterium]